MILEYYPDNNYYSYLFLKEKCRKDDSDYCVAKEVPEEHLNNLEISGFIKRKGSEIHLKEKGRWLCDPPEANVKKRKESKLDPRITMLFEIIGPPADFHKEGKYKTLFYRLLKRYEWSVIKKTAKYFAKEYEDLPTNYFLTIKAFESVKYQMDNPKKKKEELTREDFTSLGEDESLF